MIGTLYASFEGMLDASPARLSSRRGMLEKQLRDCGVQNPEVIAAALAVPRELFVSERDGKVPHTATIAILVEALQLTPSERVLQVGTGSGYAAAVLSLLALEVFSIDVDRDRADGARERLEAFGYAGISVACGEPELGWSAHAPYDAIVITDPVDTLSLPLRTQIAIGGRMIVPLRTPAGVRLVRTVRIGEATFETTELGWLERRLGKVS